jgi:aminoglycoside phosphotransferase (APT) family kinase protein
VNASLVLELIREMLGVEPIRAAHMDFGHNSVTYDVELPGRSVIARTNANPDVFAKTEHNLALLAELGLPVPRVLAVDLTKTRFPFAFMLLEKIPGRDLRYELASMTPAQMTRLAEQIIGFQRLVATLPPGRGFGWVPIGEKGPYPSWWDVVQAETVFNAETGLSAGFSASLSDRLRRCVARVRPRVDALAPYLKQVPPTCFLDDVTVKNVIVRNGELQGLVDFDVVCYGDPLFMVSLTQTGIVSDVGLGTKALFYIEELCRCWNLTARQRQIINLYSALHAMDFLYRAEESETDAWAARMYGMIRQWVG